MKDMLDAMDGNRPFNLRHIQYPLDTQEIRSMRGDESFDPLDEMIPGDRRIVADDEGTDAVVMTCHIMVVAVIVVVCPMRLKIGLFLQPTFHVGMLA